MIRVLFFNTAFFYVLIFFCAHLSFAMDTGSISSIGELNRKISCTELDALVTFNRGTSELTMVQVKADIFFTQWKEQKEKNGKRNKKYTLELQEQFNDTVDNYIASIEAYCKAYDKGYREAFNHAEKAFEQMSHFEANGKEILETMNISYQPLTQRNSACISLRRISSENEAINAAVAIHLLPISQSKDQPDLQSIVASYNDAFKSHANAQRALDSFLFCRSQQIKAFNMHLTEAIRKYEESFDYYPDAQDKLKACERLLRASLWELSQDTKDIFSTMKKSIKDVRKNAMRNKTKPQEVDEQARLAFRNTLVSPLNLASIVQAASPGC